MAKLTTSENPFEKGSNDYVLFQALKGGKKVAVDVFSEKLGHTVSNRTIGVFLQHAEKLGYRFEKEKDPELGMTYRMLIGEKAKGVKPVATEPRSYLARRKDMPTKGAKAKAAAKTAAPAKKAAAPAKKAAPAKAKKAAAGSARKVSAETTPTKAAAKKVAAKKVVPVADTSALKAKLGSGTAKKVKLSVRKG